MFHVPGYYRDVSIKLSGVLEEVGVSERLLVKRKRTLLQREIIATIAFTMAGRKQSVYFFGSQSEGSTTLGLDSDTDVLYCDDEVNVIEDWADWEAGPTNLMVIQDENVSPGYCMLQRLYNNVPQPVTEILDEHHFKLREDMVVLKNSFFDSSCPSGHIKNGPSFSSSGEGYCTQDIVYAFRFRKMPHVLDNWIQKQTTRGRLSPEMRQYIEINPCFLVAVGNKGSSHECVEWRISTSQAERCLMLNLNITQIRCYIILKMILKSFLQHPPDKGVSSFMCKNILILCIEKTPSELWYPAHLLKMVTLCLFELQSCIIHKQCPHFIERRNNLMGRKFSRVLRQWLLKMVQCIIRSNGRALLHITTDDLGRRLQTKMNPNLMVLVHNTATPDEISRKISGQLMTDLESSVNGIYLTILRALSQGSSSWPSIFKIFCRYCSLLSNIKIAEEACRLLRLFLFSNFGCVLASISLKQDELSPHALVLLRAGMNLDVASGRLKLASVLYATRDIDSVYNILRSIEKSYDILLVGAACACYAVPWFNLSEKLDIYADNHNELSVSDITAHCVRFLPSEINCIPRELQNELFRSSRDDLLHRDENDCWMDWAVVDSLPFLYFLQYKNYGHLRRPDDQQRALRNLITVAHRQNANFGHRETAWNLAGQCMRQEDRPADAFRCYVNSLNIRPRNNAANLHMCILLYRLFCSRNAL